MRFKILQSVFLLLVVTMLISCGGGGSDSSNSSGDTPLSEDPMDGQTFENATLE